MQDMPNEPAGCAARPLPLARFTVIELTVARAGPTAGRHLADWGANVIRVEPPPKDGDGADFTGERYGPDRLNLQRNKKAITLDLKTPEGKAVLMRLAATADVVIENMRANVKHRLGVDYESIRHVNPRIVYGSISGFGQEGPYHDRAGVDQIVQGMGGLMSVTGMPETGPVRAGIAVIDLTAGGFLAQGILVALLEREVTGEGRWVHTSLLESAISLLDFQAARWLIKGEVADMAGNNHPTGIPSGLFPTADGQILMAAAGDRIWERFCRAAGVAEWLDDPRYMKSAARLAHRDILNAQISALTLTQTSQHWFDLFSEAGVPCGPVNRINEVFADRQVQQLGMVVNASHPRLGDFPVVAQPNNIEGHEKAVRLPPPDLGEHTGEVLLGLGYSAVEIADFRARGIV